MAQSIILTGALIKIYLNNKPYNVIRNFSMSVDYGESEIYGIDSSYAQEIAPGHISVRGSIGGIRVKYSGGLQAANLRPLWIDFAASPYISIRVTDRSTGEDIVFIPRAKVLRESHNAPSKGVYTLNFDFAGIVPLFALDRS
jgi:hypothetical protein